MQIEDVPEDVRLEIEKQCLAKMVLSRGLEKPGLDDKYLKQYFFKKFISPVLFVGFLGIGIFVILKLINRGIL